MSTRARIDDAFRLWEDGRQEGALLMALIAVSATARKRFPQKSGVTDRDAFEKFLEEARPGRIAVEYRGECHSIEHIFYKWLRCELVHEGALPVDLELMTDVDVNVMSVRAGGAPEYLLKVSPGWFHYLVTAVVEAPENAADFSDFMRSG